MKKSKRVTEALSTVVPKKARKTKSTPPADTHSADVAAKEVGGNLREAELTKDEELKQALEDIDNVYVPKPHFGPEDLRPRHAYIKNIPETANNELRRQYKQFEAVAGDLALHRTSELVQARKKLISEFPYAINIIDSVLGQQARRHSIGLTSTLIEPVLIVGPPGLGKSRIARQICKVLNVHYRCISVAGMGDANIFGVSRGWGTAAPSILTELVAEAGYANPVLIFDEIEKIPREDRNGNIHKKLLGVLEKSEACHFFEPFFAASVDASHIGWIFTANSLEGIPGPLRSRLKVLEMAVPRVEHLPAIIVGMRAEIAQEQGLDVRWVQGLDGAELGAITGSYKEHRNVRILRAQVQNLVMSRKMTLQQH